MRAKINNGVITLVSIIFFSYMTIIRVLLAVVTPSEGGLRFSQITKAFATGFVFDLATLLYMLIPVSLYLLISPRVITKSRFHSWFILSLFLLFNAAMIFNVCAEYLFFDEFGTRFNFIAVDYLIYTREVVGNIRESYPMPIIFTGIAAVSLIISYLLYRKVLSASEITFRSNYRRTGILLAILPLAPLAFLNVNHSSISTNSFANEIAGNGIYNLVAAFRNNELDFNRFYLSRKDETVLSKLKDEILEQGSSFPSPITNPFTRRINNPTKSKKLNLIVIVEESLSAEYLGVFGNKENLTPNLDRYSKKSLLFTNMYATGTRTVRGLEALNLSIPPLPGTAIVKRPDNGGFNSWGEVLKKNGYDNKYIYAGYGYFDNMNAFFSRNGFSIVDRASFAKDETSFANIWGVCDEDLFKKTISEARKSYDGKKPFFSVVMTTSNHRPFTYPENKIDIPSKTGRSGGVKYADYSIGQLLDKASKEPWFKDTIFVIIADHCAGSAGKSDIPIKKYEIPMLVYSPAHIPFGRYDSLASQIDVAPTVLGLMGISYDSDFFGRDLFKAGTKKPKAFVSTYQKLGYLTEDSLTVLGPIKYLAQYTADRKTGVLRKKAVNENDLQEALSFYQGGEIVYRKRWNRLNSQP